MEHIKEEFLNILAKAWVWFLYVLLGIMAQYSYDLINGKKLTKWQRLGSTFIAAFIGIMSSFACIELGKERLGMFIVPVATLLSRDIFAVIMTHNWQRTFKDALKGFLKFCLDKVK